MTTHAQSSGQPAAAAHPSAPAAASPGASSPPGPTQLAVSPGTAILGTATIASLFTALWANQVPGPAAGALAYQWSDPFTIQAYYADGSIMTFKGEARPIVPTVIKLS